MLLKDTRSSEKPSVVAMDEREDGSKIVRIAGEVQEVKEDGQTLYEYDEVVFTLEPGRTETVEDIQENLWEWWSFGSQEEESEPTLEERISAIEDFILEM